ncbi:MAG: antitoxin VapB family protein [archaeon]
MVTTIQIDEDLKEKLDELKLHHRESYNALIQRILENCTLNSMDNESLIATIEVLSDPDLMRGIKEALEEENRGEKGTSLEDLKKELKL